MLKTQLQDGNKCLDTTIRKKRLNFNWPWDGEFVKLTLSGNFQMLNKNVAEEEFITEYTYIAKSQKLQSNL